MAVVRLKVIDDMEKKDKKTFLLYYDQAQIWDGLSDRQAGKLIKLLHKNSNASPPKNDPLIKYAYNIIKQKIDCDYDKWEDKCNRAKKSSSCRWGKADVVTGSNDKKRSERLSLARKKASHTKKEWEDLLSIFDCCPRCGGNGSPIKDHIVPIYKGGSDGIENLQPLCKKCNSQKGPDETDFRPKDWKKQIGERLRISANACECLPMSKTPGTPADNDNDNDNDNDIF